MKKISMRYFVLLSSLLVVFLGACSKDEFDADAQFSKEIADIKAYLKTNNLSAVQDSTSGIFYAVEVPGNGVDSITNYKDSVTVLYTGRLLSTGKVFDSTGTKPVKLAYNELILGWQLALAKSTKGTKMRIYLPSWYAYGTRSVGGIPANSTLIFDMELLDITKH